MQTFNTKSNISVYYELTKPKIWYLLVFTAFGAALTASNVFNVPISLQTWALLLGGVAAGSAAANTLTNYHDRDIDAIMERTKGRPIPSRRIYPAENALEAAMSMIKSGVKSKDVGRKIQNTIMDMGFKQIGRAHV